MYSLRVRKICTNLTMVFTQHVYIKHSNNTYQHKLCNAWIISAYISHVQKDLCVELCSFKYPNFSMPKSDILQETFFLQQPPIFYTLCHVNIAKPLWTDFRWKANAFIMLWAKSKDRKQKQTISVQMLTCFLFTE